MKRTLPATALVALLFLAAWLKSSLPPTLHHSFLIAAAPDGIRLVLLQQGQKDSEQCLRNTAMLAGAIQGSCPECRVQETACLAKLTVQQNSWLGEAPLTASSTRIPNGVIVYESPNSGEALQACLESEKQAKFNPPEARLTCHPAGVERPLPSGQREKFAKAHFAQRILGYGTAALFSLLAVLLLSGLYRKRRSLASPQSAPTFPWIQKLTLAGTDATVLLATFTLLGFPAPEAFSVWIRYDLQQLFLHLTLTGTALAWFWVGLEHYGRRRPFWDELREIFRTLGILLLLAGAAMFYAGLEAGRAMTLWIWASAFILLPLGRATAKAALDGLGLWRHPCVIIGTGENARDAYLAVKGENSLGYSIFAFVNSGIDSDNVPETISVGDETLPVLTPAIYLESLLKELGNPQIIVALESLGAPESQLLVQQLNANHQNIHVIPAIRGLPLFGTRLSHFFSHEVLFLTVRNNLSRRSYQWVKRAFDIITAAMLLALLSPLFAALSLLIRQTGATPFYGHTRVGRNGKPFKCLKFRSMRPDADAVLKKLLANDPVARAEWEKDFKLKNDPRITPVGHFLRKTSLDELPQLINVIKGEMSLVGPRPIITAELERYGDYAWLYLQVRPGITGLWQVSGRNDTTYAERIGLDAWYVQNWSLWYDVAILFKTIDVVLARRGAY